MRTALAFFTGQAILRAGELKSDRGSRAVGVLPSGIEEGDFELIQAAVRETERGRWFLDEFARRVRADDASRIVAAIDDLNRRLATRQAADEQMRAHLEAVVALLAALAEALDVQKRDLGAERRAAPQGG